MMETYAEMSPVKEMQRTSINRKGTQTKKHAVGAVFYAAVKRVFDVVCAVAGIILLVPLTVAIKIMYMADGDFHPLLFAQNRIGKDGKEFRFYKFRSMIPDADEALEKLLRENPDLREEYQKNKKLKNDPRITRGGAILRKTSLDEFPQFINVLRGDMAIVGNRPYLPREKADMGDYFDDIVKTKCGVISYWAVNGRSDVSFEERLELEAYYSNNRSLRLDMKIFFAAFAVVLGCKGVE